MIQIMERYFKLSNGEEIPSVGFGTWLTPAGAVAVESVECALADGYRHIDTAAAYENERSVGEGIAQSGVPRGDLFVTSKVWNTERGYDSTLRAFDKSCSYLGMDYLDLYLIHWPASPNKFADWKRINAETWRAMERIYDEKRVRSIGVSNFLRHHLEALIESARIVPMVNQIEYHPGFMQEGCVRYCEANNILVEAWSPLGRGRVLNNELLLKLAAKYGKSVAQICLRWELQHGVLPLPKSVTPQRIKENIEVFDFELTAEDMLMIDNMGDFGASGLDPDTVDF